MGQILDLGSTEVIQERVKIGGIEYLLKEATGAAVVKFRNYTVSKARMKGGEVVGMDGGVADAEPLLVSQCLYQLDDGKPTNLVPLQVITAWPARIQKQLFDKVKEMSKMDQPETKDQITKQMADLQKQLDELEGNTDPNSASAT